MYYIVAGIVLIVTVGVIIALQNSSVTEIEDPIVNKPAVAKPVKTEIETASDVAKSMGSTSMPSRITMDDNGQKSSVTSGKILVLMLGTDYNWDIKSSDNKVIAKKDVTLTDARVQAVYQAVQAGSATLTATGTCKATCATPTASFKLDLESVVTDNMSADELMK